jgi:hypothetical protein
MSDSKERDISDILSALAQPNQEEDLSVYRLMNEWFNPRQELMKHVIVIQMIACFMVGLFLVVTAGESLSPEGLMVAIFGFLIFVAAAFGVHTKL